MNLIYSEIQHIISDCETNKKAMLREADRIHEERKAYQSIRDLMGVVYEENNHEACFKISQ